MLHEYDEVFSALVGIMDTAKSVSEGAVDSIDLADVVNPADNLANFVFGGNHEYIPVSMISGNEAWDFVSALSRLSDFFGLDRSAVYAAAAEEYDGDKKRAQYYDAVLKTLDKAGGM